MTTIKPVLNTRPNKDGRHTLILQVLHNRRRGVVFTKYKLFSQEFNAKEGRAVAINRSRVIRERVKEINNYIVTQTTQLRKVLDEFNRKGEPFLPTDITSAYHQWHDRRYIHTFTLSLIDEYEIAGRHGTARTYRSTLSIFEKFCGNKKFRFDEINSAVLLAFENYMKRVSLQRNTISFYMRTLRALYNKARRELIVNKYDTPFDSVTFREDKTRKRAVSEDVLRRVINADIPNQLILTRDLFLFSFYSRGMSFVDIIYLKQDYIKDGILRYNRRKTGQPFSIRITNHMEEILLRYNHSTPWAFPIMIDSEDTPLTQKQDESETEFNQRLHNCYKKALSYHLQNMNRISATLGLDTKLSFNVARHSWASLARNRGIPLTIISSGLGHTSEKTTNIYLDDLDNSKLDEANDIITNIFP